MPDSTPLKAEISSALDMAHDGLKAFGDDVFERHPVIAILLTPSWVAGIHRVRTDVYMILNLVGAAVWAAGIGLAAYWIGPSVIEFVNDLGLVTTVLLGAVIAAVVAAEVVRRRRRRPEPPDTKGPCRARFGAGAPPFQRPGGLRRGRDLLPVEPSTIYAAGRRAWRGDQWDPGGKDPRR